MDLGLRTVPGSWIAEAACLGADPEIFFPPHGALFTAARAICAGCPVVGACRSYVDAIEASRSDLYGFVGGETPSERTRRRRASEQGGRCYGRTMSDPAAGTTSDGDLVVAGGTPTRPLPDDLDELARELEAATELRARVVPPDQMPAGVRGVTWWELVSIFIPHAPGDDLLGLIVGVVAKWGYDRMRKRKATSDPPSVGPPLAARLYGPDGKVWKKVELTDPDEEPTVRDDDDWRPPPERKD
jgi:WhiB family transcriptional regulator, redox-sensing transcriptional regulator